MARLYPLRSVLHNAPAGCQVRIVRFTPDGDLLRTYESPEEALKDVFLPVGTYNYHDAYMDGVLFIQTWEEYEDA